MPAVTDVTDATFEADVLDRSTQATIVVDLWASWCGPCRVLGPILEKVVAESDGVELVKIDVDANPRSAATFQVQSIPAVYAIRDRRVVDSFIGALPEPAVRQWIAGLNPPPSEVDLLVAKGDEDSLRRAVDLEPANEKAVLALASLLAADGSGPDQREEALRLLARLPESAETRHIAAQARLGAEAETAGGSDGVEAKLDELLERVRADEAARQEFLDLLEMLGPDDPRTAAYRKALTARLF
ncbi:MAG TPA: tetratricopeptide repeat protein [Acidimicrobiales bacterium]|nr:tetratricopeptide repeat protein [Acidimicrobiales bacterium]